MTEKTAKPATKKAKKQPPASLPTSPDSPFEDKFDLDAAIKMVGDLYTAPDPDQNDPRFSLLMAIWDHEQELEQIRTEDKLRQQAEPIVPYDIASQRPSRLIKPTEMTLHTLQAQRLFTGRRKSNGIKGIPGFMTFAKTCFQLWMLTANNNPYADWLLIQISNDLKLIHGEIIEGEVKRLKSILETRKNRGLSHGIAESAKPLVIGGISFGSPYGYMALDLLMDFDYFVRVVSTLEDVGQINTNDSRDRKENLQRRLRGFIYKYVRLADILANEKLLPLTRADFSADADDDGKIRAALAAKLIGELPQDVLKGELRPDHYKPVRAPAVKPAPAGKKAAPTATKSEGEEHAPIE